MGTAIRDGYLDAAGVSLHYVEQGEGEPVVLLHGYTSDIRGQWMEPECFPPSRVRTARLPWMPVDTGRVTSRTTRPRTGPSSAMTFRDCWITSPSTEPTSWATRWVRTPWPSC